MTTFDDVYEVFQTITWGIDEYNLPQTIDGQKQLIFEGVRRYNKRLNLEEEDAITCDNTLEEFSVEMSEQEISLLAHCMKWAGLDNMVMELASMLSMSSKDTALKDYKAMITTRQLMVENEKKEIYNIAMLLNDCDDLLEGAEG